VLIPESFVFKRYCCQNHERRGWKRAQRAEGRSFYVWDEGAKARYHRRRARKKVATVRDPFTNLEVFERDGWVCYLCETSVDRTLGYPDPLSASLDHEIPLEKGGEHSWENCRLAHFSCNVMKGARDAAELGLKAPAVLAPRPPRRSRRRRKTRTETIIRRERMPDVRVRNSPRLARIWAEAIELRASLESVMPPG
jgi:5-methylcytosine-specific restriction endonuclease McrA